MVNIRYLIKEEQRLYKKTKSVYCPILDEKVYFTSAGFRHLIYKSTKKRRNIGEQYMKLKCLKFAPRVIKNCTEISSTRHTNKWIKGKEKQGRHYELVYEVYKGKRIRVIVEKIGTGRCRFLSVMPHDKHSKPKKRRKRRPLEC